MNKDLYYEFVKCKIIRKKEKNGNEVKKVQWQKIRLFIC